MQGGMQQMQMGMQNMQMGGMRQQPQMGGMGMGMMPPQQQARAPLPVPRPPPMPRAADSLARSSAAQMGGMGMPQQQMGGMGMGMPPQQQARASPAPTCPVHPHCLARLTRSFFGCADGWHEHADGRHGDATAAAAAGACLSRPDLPRPNPLAHCTPLLRPTPTASLHPH